MDAVKNMEPALSASENFEQHLDPWDEVGLKKELTGKQIDELPKILEDVSKKYLNLRDRSAKWICLGVAARRI